MRLISRLILLGLTIASFSARAQDDGDNPDPPGWFLDTNPGDPGPEFDPSGPDVRSPATNVVGGLSAVAEVITPEIAALARGLEYDPKRIFDYVHDHIRYIH